MPHFDDGASEPIWLPNCFPFGSRKHRTAYVILAPCAFLSMDLRFVFLTDFHQWAGIVRSSVHQFCSSRLSRQYLCVDHCSVLGRRRHSQGRRNFLSCLRRPFVAVHRTSCSHRTNGISWNRISTNVDSHRHVGQSSQLSRGVFFLPKQRSNKSKKRKS